MAAIRRGSALLRNVGTFTLGAAVGSIFALLYAPASGKATRRRLAQQASKWQKNAMRGLDRTGRTLAIRAAHVRDAATEWISEHVPHGNGAHRSRRGQVRHAEAH